MERVISIHRQRHGYVRGHQLLASSVSLKGRDQEQVDRLSDLSGVLGPREKFEPYLTGYPLLPSRFYVLAKTWYDDTAPRAGCVLTESFLVPLDVWMAMEEPDCLDKHFQFFEKVAVSTVLAPLALSSNDHRIADNISNSRGTNDFVSALFFEKRQPIAWFGTERPNALAWRTIRSLWPAMRRNFSFCTYALQPRQIEGRDFDLVFGPNEVRSRFAGWSGRKIDASESKVAASPKLISLANEIFVSPRPSLLNFDELNIMARDQRGDPTALRMALLWADLRERLKVSPTALLGMLDIINALELAPEEFQLYVTDPISDAIELACSSLQGSEAFQFLHILVGKLSGAPVKKRFYDDIERAAFILASKGLGIAIEHAFSGAERGTRGQRAVRRGIAEAAADNIHSPELADILFGLSSAALLRFMSTSSAAVKVVLTASRKTSLAKRLDDIISSAPQMLRRRLRLGAMSQLTAVAEAGLLENLFRDVTVKEIDRVIEELFRQFEHPAENAHVISAVQHLMLRNVFATRVALYRLLNVSSDAMDLLVGSLRVQIEDLLWVWSLQDLSTYRKAEVLVGILSRASTYELRRISLADEFPGPEIIKLLTQVETAVSALQVARLLPFVRLDVLVRTDVVIHLLQYLREDDSASLVAELFEDVFPTLHPELIGRLLILLDTDVGNRALQKMGAYTVVSNLFPRRLNQQQYESALILSSQNDGTLKLMVQRRFDDVVEKLVARVVPYSEISTRAWAELLSTNDPVARTTITAAGATLRYAMSGDREEAAILALASFPIVYQSVISENYNYEVSKLFKFTDWDYGKTLREMIVAKFLKSSWPCYFLVLIADRSDIVRQVLSRISRSVSGTEFLRRLETELSSACEQDQMRAAKILKSFQAGELSPGDWD